MPPACSVRLPLLSQCSQLAVPMLVEVGGSSPHWKGKNPSASPRKEALFPGVRVDCKGLAETWDLREPQNLLNRGTVQQTNQHFLRPRADNSIEVWKKTNRTRVVLEPWTTPVPVPQSSKQKPGFALLRLEMYTTERSVHC